MHADLRDQFHRPTLGVTQMKKIWCWGPQLIVSLMLLWALNPDNVYGYYILLRWVCCVVFAYLTLLALAQEKQGWVWVLGITALVYNPIIRVHLTREIWSIINVITIGIAVASIYAFRSDRRPPAQATKPGSRTEAATTAGAEDTVSPHATSAYERAHAFLKQHGIGPVEIIGLAVVFLMPVIVVAYMLGAFGSTEKAEPQEKKRRRGPSTRLR